MRVFIVVLVLIFSFQSWTKAEDISEFEIEEMSIGDSLFDYISEKELKNKPKAKYKNSKFIAIIIEKHNFEIYDAAQVVYKNVDKKIHGIDGILMYKNNLKKCLKKRDEIITDISELFSESKKRDKGKFKHNDDKTGKSFFYSYDLELESGAAVKVICYDWSKELTERENWPDSLTVTLNSKEFVEFLKNEQW